jgi:methyl-accepting chemotaxis protein
LAGNTEIEDSVQRLDKLTQEEARMASAELLKVTHGVNGKVDDVHGEVQDIGNKVQNVDNRVQGIGSVVKDISSEVREVNRA